MNIVNTTALELSKKLRKKEISAVEIVKAYGEVIDRKEKEINAYITLNEKAINEAEDVDRSIMNGEEIGRLAGIPIAVKDNIMVKDIRATCASKMLENFVPPYDATVIEKIREHSGIILGKANMDEFAVGASNETSYFGIVRNPIDTTKVPGGSSGGSAAAIKSLEAALALGTDTGGSVRQPASFCGVVGIKPTYGSISRYGVVSMANTLDQVGSFGKNVRDAFFLLESLMGFDKKDETSVNRSYEKIDDISKSDDEVIENEIKKISKMKIAVINDFFTEELNEKIKQKILDAIIVLEKLGAKIEWVDFPHKEYALPAYYTIATSELSSNLSRFDGVRFGYRSKDYSNIDELYMNSRKEGFGEEVKRRILLGAYATSGGFKNSFYRKALQARTLIINDFKKIFSSYDLVVAPTTPELAFDIGGKMGDPMSMYLADLYTVPLNLCGLCGMSMPCGEVEGLPVGLQFIADRFMEKNIFTAGIAYEGGYKNGV